MMCMTCTHVSPSMSLIITDLTYFIPYIFLHYCLIRVTEFLESLQTYMTPLSTYEIHTNTL